MLQRKELKMWALSQMPDHVCLPDINMTWQVAVKFKLWNTCWGKLLTGSWNSPREQCSLQSTKMKGVRDLKSALTSDMDIQNLEFIQLVSCLAWSSNSSLGHFGVIMYILWCWKYVICFCFCFYRGLLLRDCLNLRRDFELWAFKHCWDCDRLWELLKLN